MTTEPTPPTPPTISTATGGTLSSDTCWKCGHPRDIYGDGDRHCSFCGAGDPGWEPVSSFRI